jgi:hypothetical protein
MGPLRKVIWRTSALTGIFIMVLCVGLLSQAGAGILFSDSSLPPESDPPDCENLESVYAGEGIHALYPGPIEMSDPRYKCFENVFRQAIGNDEREDFDCIWECEMDFGSGPVSVTLTGSGTHMVYGRLLSTAGMFDCEIVDLFLTGTGGGYDIQLRESPTLASLGVTNISDVGGGMYEIDSFFDVYTELSLDGGEWMPQTAQAARITLVPASSVSAEPTLWGSIKSLFD